ncbi:transcription factor jumonji domain-containing protein [Arabidopsis lyrata subsp. lyrata]|uniref:Transcription factor jumonji domain-containing protein n=1 Tax=Arabidopsis lyrata subsp. lyrata TaxID=81972 RepID=D7LZC2_ARALL|nr:transcription factor jumonji domain-containing protein [Arabidopsis lyrata subsp. lyrata]
MPMGCEFPKIQTFESALSAADFESTVELTNFPAVFRGCASDWDAYSKWNPFNSGLDYLEERAGSVEVEAMLSRTAPIFNGDIRSHDRVSLPFSDFIRFCKQHISDKGNGSDVDAKSADLTPMPEDYRPGQIYLAQFPILNDEKEEKVQLKILRQDIQTPTLLGEKSLSSINFWMNSAQARSSTHYDPHHNLLCVVSGRKKVVLWPPSASPSLYPMPIYGEASNHSSVGLENPNLSYYPRAEHSLKQSQKVILNAGDAVFIPEGWFHQVDSEELTVAVNFWWQSNIMSNMPEHMDSYYLRRIARRLIDREMSLLVSKPSSTDLRHQSEHIDQSHIGMAEGGNDNVGNESIKKGLSTLHEKASLHDLDPSASQALHELISLVHDHVNAVDTKDDRVAHLLWNLEASRLRDVLLAMARYFPRTLEALILHMLSPIAAEVLTQKFDEIDQQTGEEDRNQFFREFYGAFDDEAAAMDIILSRKESFAFQAFKSVLDKYLGVNIASPTINI